MSAAAEAKRRTLESLPARDWLKAAWTLEGDGVVFLKNALGANELALIEKEFAHSVSNPSPKAVNFYPGENATFPVDVRDGDRLSWSCVGDTRSGDTRSV